MGGIFAEVDAIPIQDLLPALNEGLSTTELFGTAEALECAQAMSDANDIMLSESMIYKL